VGVLDVVAAGFEAVVPAPWSSRSLILTTKLSRVCVCVCVPQEAMFTEQLGTSDSVETLEKSAKWMLGHTDAVGRSVFVKQLLSKLWDFKFWKIHGFHGNGAVSSGKWVPAFWRELLLLSWGLSRVWVGSG